MTAKIEPPPEDEIRHLYHGEGFSTIDLSDHFDVSRRTIGRWMEKYGIEPRPKDGADGGPWTDPDKLQELYHEKEMSIRDVADELGCHNQTVFSWMEKHGIERRPKNDPNDIGHYHRPDGYEICETLVGDKYERVRVHRLVAVAKYGIRDVKGLEVHHRNHIPWDNRPDNIELIDPTEHRRLHYYDAPRCKGRNLDGSRCTKHSHTGYCPSHTEQAPGRESRGGFDA